MAAAVARGPWLEGLIELEPVLIGLINSQGDQRGQTIPRAASVKGRFTGTLPDATTGIGIITYNRPELLRECLDSVLKFTASERHIHLAVFDDCSDYNIHSVVQGRCPVKRSLSNQGVVYTKNRALYYFASTIKTKRIILLEDDMLVTSKSWLPTWEKACKIHGHINYSAPWFFSDELKGYFLGGEGSAINPHRFVIVTGQCTAVRRALIRNSVGYINPEFKGYGYGHVEWSDRLAALGHGGFIAPGKKAYYSIAEGLQPLSSESLKVAEQIEMNEKTFARLSQDPSQQFVGTPWLNRREKRLFLADL